MESCELIALKQMIDYVRRDSGDWLQGRVSILDRLREREALKRHLKPEVGRAFPRMHRFDFFVTDAALKALGERLGQFYVESLKVMDRHSVGLATRLRNEGVPQEEWTPSVHISGGEGGVSFVKDDQLGLTLIALDEELKEFTPPEE